MEQFMRYIRLPSAVGTCIILVLNHTLRRQRRLKGAYVPYQVRLRTFQFSVRLGSSGDRQTAISKAHRKEIPHPGKNASGNM